MTAELIIQVLLYVKTTSGIDYASSITEELICIIYFFQRPSIIDLKRKKNCKGFICVLFCYPEVFRLLIFFFKS